VSSYLESLFDDLDIRAAIEQMKDQPDHFDETGFYQVTAHPGR